MTTLAPKLRPRDPTAALRVRRWRAKKLLNGGKAVFTLAGARPQISTPEICTLAVRVGAGLASTAELQLAEKLVMALVDRLPPDSSIEVR